MFTNRLTLGNKIHCATIRKNALQIRNRLAFPLATELIRCESFRFCGTGKPLDNTEPLVMKPSLGVKRRAKIDPTAPGSEFHQSDVQNTPMENAVTPGVPTTPSGPHNMDNMKTPGSGSA
jgi:hypothetical protein